MGISEDTNKTAARLKAKIFDGALVDIDSDQWDHQDDAYWAGIDHAIEVIEEYFSE